MTSALVSPEDESTVQRQFSFRSYFLILLQMVLVSLMAYQFHLDEIHYLPLLLAIMTGTYAVHALLPMAYRLPFFVLLSMACIVLVVGPQGALMVGLAGGGLLGITSLPIRFSARVLLVLLLTGVLIWLRNQSTADFWAIVGSMFMFRLIVYMFTERQAKQTGTLWERLAYFFMTPNSFYVLFPVVDYKIFRTNYYNDKDEKIYQTGVHWIVLGIVQLLIYRLLKVYALPAPMEIDSTREVVLYLAANYGLYVRISGQFHLICGILHLFGFNLPRTHDHYFLASSFSEIWRRINIYWKNFLSNVVFFPVYFRLRRLGDVPAIVISVMIVFLATWLAHSWQVFWLMGRFPFHAIEAYLWLAAGGLVAINAYSDYRRARLGKRRSDAFQLGRSIIHSLKIIGVFFCVSLFWVRWSSSPKVLEFLLYTVRESGVERADILWVGGALLTFILLSVLVQFLRQRFRGKEHRDSLLAALVGKGELGFDRSVAVHLIPLVLVVLLSQPNLSMHFPMTAQNLLYDLQNDRVAMGDALANIDGYYEQLNDGSVQSGPFLAPPVNPMQERFAGQFMSMVRGRNDIMQVELIPGWNGEFNGVPTTVNRWSMRDRENLSLVKPPKTYRIAVVGSSIVMGYGVGDEQTLTRLLENQLNKDLGSEDHRFEVLNFGVGRHFAIQRRAHIEKRVIKFQPDLILYVAHQDEMFHTVDGLLKAYHDRVNFEDPCLDDLVRKMGLKHEMTDYAKISLVNQHLVDILTCTYRRILEIVGPTSSRIAYVYLPIPGEHATPVDPQMVLKLAEEVGFPVIDLTGWWGDHSASEVIMPRASYHPSVLGAELIADRLEEELLRRPELLNSAAQ